MTVVNNTVNLCRTK